MWYKVPIENGQPNYEKGTATHSATSNGDGTYNSKNGAEGNRPNETMGHLTSTYGAHGSVSGGYMTCMSIKIKDC